MPKYRDEELKTYALNTFKGGYNSYAGGKSTVEDNEIPYGLNSLPTDNGSFAKRNGSALFGGEVATGKAIRGIGHLKTSSLNVLIVAAGTACYYKDGNNYTGLSGFTFTNDKDTQFCQAIDKLYIANGSNNLVYTDDGETITEISSNGNIGSWPVFYNQRIYMTNATYKDRIYYSNPYSLNLASSPPTLTGFNDDNMFNTDLSSDPKKNAGYIVLFPGGGVEITRLFLDNSAGSDYLYAYTKSHGIWRIAYSSINEEDGSVAHTISQVATNYGTPSGRSVAKVGNDQWFYGGDNQYSLGEVAQYQNIRITTKSGRIRSEMSSISSKTTVAATFYEDHLYLAYATGSYNDKFLIYDTKLNAWSTPCSGIAINCFYVWEDSNGVTRLLAGSADSDNSYIYELETGTDDNETAVNGYFETKSTNCKTSLKKYFGYVDVFYTTLYGVVTYEVFIDEILSISGQVQLGNSSDKPAGLGSRALGEVVLGGDYWEDATTASLAQNSFFRIDCNYKSGHKISVKITNNNSGEQYKIDGIIIYYLPGSFYEE